MWHKSAFKTFSPGRQGEEMKTFAVICLSLATAFSSTTPAQAFPTMNAPKVADVQLIQHRAHTRQWYRNRSWARNSYNGRHYSNRYSGRQYRYNGRHYHYRDYDNNDFGFLFGGLATGAIIGGLIAQPRYYGGNSHASWCYSRYRSYRAYDNTFQPYYGPRRQCVGPY